MKLFTHRFFLLLFFLPAITSFAQQKELTGMPGKTAVRSGNSAGANYTGFPDEERVPDDVWRRINPGAADDPDAFYEKSSNGKKYVEVVSKRTVNKKYYINPDRPAEFLQDEGYSALNYQKDGKWYTVDTRLKPAGNNVYEAASQWEPVGVDANAHNTYIRMASGRLTFNRWNLYGGNDNHTQLIAAADWSHYTVGADGVRIKDIFPGIDAEMHVARGTVKTNFIVHNKQYAGYKELYFRDEMEGLNENGLHFEAGLSVDAHTPVYGAVGNNKSAIKISPALVYEKNNSGDVSVMSYKLSGNALNIVVPVSYLKQHSGDIVIDPQVISTNSIAQSLVGTPYNASCTWTTACDYTINVVPPSAAVITDVQDQVEVIATAPCGVENFGYQIVSGTCYSPAAGVVWISNGQTGPGTMWAGFYSEPNLVACMPAASCTPASVAFTFHLYRTCVGPTTPACDNTCLGLNNPLSVRIVGYTVQYASIAAYPADTTCYGNTLGIKALPQYGVTPYATTNWSFSNTGSPSIGTGDSISLGVLSPGTYTVYANTTDACGVTAQTSKVVTVYPVPAISAVTKTNPTTCSTTDGTVTLYGLSASTVYTVNYTKNATAATPAVIRSDAGGALTISGLSAGTYTSFQVTAHTCPSAVSALSVTLVNPVPSSIAVTGNPCTAIVITMTANPSWGINTWQYNGSPLRTDTLLTWSTNGTVVAGVTGSTGSANNQFATGPLGVYTDVSGNVYVADNNNHRIMKWRPGAATGILVAGGNGAGSGLNQFNAPYGVYADADSNVYVADRNNNRIIKWAPGATAGVVVAGGNGAGSGLNQINAPRGVFVDAAKNVYVADFTNNRIMKWVPGATTGTVAAGGNGAGSAANQLNSPTNVYVDAAGTMYIADFSNNRIVKWLSGATSGTTVAGGNGAGSAANQFNSPRGIKADANGFLYIADQNNNRIQKWVQGAASGVTVAGGNGAGTALNQVNNPVDLAMGTDGSIYAMEQNNTRVTKFTPKTTDTLVAGASGTYSAIITSFNGCTNTGSINWIQKDTVTISANPGSIICSGTSVTFTASVLHAGTSPVYTWKRNGTVAGTNSATFTTTALTNRDVISCTFSSSNPCTVTDSIVMTVNPLPAVTLTGNPCTANMITMTSSPVWSLNTWKNNGTNIVTDTNKWNAFATVAAGGNGAGSGLNQINFPLGVFADAAGNTYVADPNNHRIVKWAPGATSGTVVAGGNGAGSAANQLSYPFAVAVDADTNVYVMEWGNARVSKWAYGATSGTVVAGGNGNGSALNQLNAAQGLFVDANKNVYVSDNSNARVVKWAPGATSGVLVAGGNGTGSGLNQFNNPVSVYVDGAGNMYVSDYNNNRIMKWAPGAASGVVVAGGNGSGSAANQLNGPRCSWLDGSGNIYICDQNNNRIQRWFPGATSGVTVAAGNGAGTGLNQLNSPTGIYVSGNGDIYTVEQNNNRALKFSPKQADTLIPTNTATYTATVTDYNGCINTGSINWIQADTLILSANPGYEVCANAAVTFTATVLHPGTSLVYTWKKNGTVVGSNSATYTAASLNNNDRITCSVTSSNPCSLSDSVVMRVNPMPNVSISGTPCTNKKLTLNMAATSLQTKWLYNGSAFQTYDAAWVQNGTVVAGGNGAGSAANQLNNPCTVFVDAAGNIIIADNNNQRIQKWTPSATSGTTVAGGNGSGSALNQFAWGNGVIPGYNNLDIYVSDANNNRVAQWLQGGATGTVAAGNNGSGTAANQVRPFNAALDGYGNLFLPDVSSSARVMKWKLGYLSGITVAGGNGVGTAANQFNQPYAICIDNNANDIYISDPYNFRIQKWTSGGTTGVTVAGGNGSGSAANQLNYPLGIQLDGLKNLYIADASNSRIQRWAPGATSGVTIIGGNGAGTALNQLNSPDGIFMDGNGNMYIPENGNARVTKFPAYNTDTLIPANAGTYKVIVTTFKGCTDSATYTVNLTPVVTGKTSVNPATCAGANGSITLNGLTASTTYSVSYKKNGTTVGPVSMTSNGSGSIVITGLSSGAYNNFSIVAASGCTSALDTATINLADPNPPAAPSVSSNTPVCAGQTLNLSTPAASGVTYNWTGPNSFSSNSQNPSITSVTAAAAGIYSLTTTNTSTGCTSAAGTTTVVINPLPAVPTAGSNSPICSGQTLNLTASTTTGGATYSWTGPNSFSTTTQNPSITGATTAATGTYSVISVLNGCQSAAATVNVSVNVTPVISGNSSVNPATCGGTSGSISLSGMAASTSYTINYSKNGTAVTPVNLTSTSGGVITIPNLTAGSYTNISVGSGAGCTSNIVAGPITLTDPALPSTPVAGSNSPLCAGQSLNLTASSASTGITYSWTGPNGFTSSSQNPVIAAVTAAAAGTYSVTVTNTTTLCTSAAGTTAVTVKPLPIDPVAGSNSPICSGQILNLTASASTSGATYSWSGPNSFTSPTQNPSITGATTAASGTYSVVTLLNGCQSANTGTVNVTVNVTPVVSSNSSSNPSTCNGSNGSITLNGMAPATTYTINYSKNGTAVSPLTLNSSLTGVITIPNLTAGTYTNITVGSGAGCTSSPVASITLTDPALPVTPTAGSNSPVCAGGPLNLTAATTSTGVTYSWSGPNSFTSSAQNPVIAAVTAAAAGTYTVTVTSTTTLCTSSPATTTVTVKPLPTDPTAGSNSPVCQGQTLNLTATATTSGATYSWSGPNSFTSTLQNPSISPVTLAANGAYTVVTLLNGCQSANSSTVNVTIKPLPAVPTVSSNSPVCSGTGNTLQLNASSSTTGVTYSWSGPNSFTSATQNPSVIAPSTAAGGTYTVTVALNGCTVSGTTNVVINQTPAAPAVTNISYCQYEPSSALTATGSNLKWYTAAAGGSPLSAAPIPSTQVPGTYTWYVTQTDGVNGCESQRSALAVTVKPKPAAPSGTGSYTFCQFEPTQPLVIAGQNLLWYQVATGGTGSSITPAPNTTVAGTYSIWVSQTVLGCESDRFKIDITVKPKPAPPVVNTPIYYCQYSPSSPLTAIGQNLKWYSISTGGNGTTTAPTPPTGYQDTLSYYVTQTVNGCESDRSRIDVIVHYLPNGVIIASKSQVCQYDTATFTYFGNALPGALYDWKTPVGISTIVSGNASGPGPVVIRFDSSGQYRVRMQVNDHGCVSNADFYDVTVKPAPYVRAAVPANACVDETVMIALNYAAGGIENYTWSFDGGNIVYGSYSGPFGIAWHAPGEYHVSVVATAKGCPSKKLIDTITIHALPDVKINNVSANDICAEDMVTFSAGDADSGSVYTWSPAIYFGGLTNAGPVVSGQVAFPGYIRVNVTTPWGCGGSDSVYVNAHPCCEVALPDAFTPNGDGRNDLFRIITKGNHKISTFRVVNRWGQVVFETADEKMGWDGSLGGVQQEIGTYYYYLKYKCIDGEYIEKRGEVTLIR